MLGATSSRVSFSLLLHQPPLNDSCSIVVIPRRGLIGKWLNPFPFNSKEHIAIVIMANAAATSALATEVVGVQRLWYKTSPGPGNSIFLMLSSQLLGESITISKESLTFQSALRAFASRTTL